MLNKINAVIHRKFILTRDGDECTEIAIKLSETNAEWVATVWITRKH